MDGERDPYGPVTVLKGSAIIEENVRQSSGLWLYKRVFIYWRTKISKNSIKDDKKEAKKAKLSTIEYEFSNIIVIAKILFGLLTLIGSRFVSLQKFLLCRKIWTKKKTVEEFKTNYGHFKRSFNATTEL